MFTFTPCQPRQSDQGEKELIKSPARVRFTVHVTRHSMVEEDWDIMKLTRAETRQAECLAVREARKAKYSYLPQVLERENH